MYSIFKLFLYLVLGTLFGPIAAIWFKFYGDFYSLSKYIPIFDLITEEWLLLFAFFIFWNGFYFLFGFYYELQKYINRPPMLQWWQTEVIYQIHVKSFYDSNNDGYGDLTGVAKKLDYLNHIGIKSIMLSPLIELDNFKSVDPIYGDMKDFEELIARAHEKGMHVILESVPVMEVSRFWLEEKKVDGLRFEGVDDLSDLRDMFDEIGRRTNRTRALLVDCSYSRIEELIPYYQENGKGMAHLPLNLQFNAVDNKTGIVEFRSEELKPLIEDYLSVVPKDCWPNWQFGNNDISRVATRIGAENVNMANALNLLLGGTSIVYYGEELGMQDLSVNLLASKDDSKDISRSPMQWTGNAINAGFSQTNKPWIPVHPDNATRNVQAQLTDPDSHLNVTTSLLKLRAQPAFQWGKLKIHVVNSQIFSFTRKAYDFPTYMLVMNISDTPAKVSLETGSEIAPRAYVSLYIPGRTSNSRLVDTYSLNAPVLTKSVALEPRDCLVLTWSG